MSIIHIVSYIYIMCFKDQQDSCDNVIPVELWVRQMKVPGPLEPVKIEINCINKMLVDEGVVLPIKEYVKSIFNLVYIV